MLPAWLGIAVWAPPLVWAPPSLAAAPALSLDASSPTLVTIAAAPGDVLRPAVPPTPGPGLAPPVSALGLSALGLVTGDMTMAMSFGFDALPTGVLHFSVDRSSSGIGGLFPPDIDTEGSSGVAGDVYKSFFPPNHTLVFDGDGVGGSPAPDGLGLDEKSGSMAEGSISRSISPWRSRNGFAGRDREDARYRGHRRLGDGDWHR